jgi:hypothetical protein
MVTRQLQDVLDAIPDTGEIVIRPHPRHDAVDELLEAWRAARAEANAALARWRAGSGRTSFAVWRAAEDRADAAQDALAGRHRR